jgi:hypothetical protein
MTCGEMIADLWVYLGKDPDITPYVGGVLDDTAPGWGTLLRLLNEGQKAVCSYVGGRGHRFWYNDSEDHAYLTLEPVVTTLAADSAEGTSTLTLSTVYSADDTYKDYLVKVGEQYRTAIASQDSGGNDQLTFAAENEVDYATGDAVYLIARKVDLSSIPKFWEIKDISVTIQTDTDAWETGLSMAAKETTLADILDPGYGHPEEYRRIGKNLWIQFVDPEVTKYTLTVNYFKFPADLAETTDVSVIPENFHYGILLWAMAYGHLRGQDIQYKQEAQNTFRDFMRSTASEYFIRTKGQRVGWKVDK